VVAVAAVAAVAAMAMARCGCRWWRRGRWGRGWLRRGATGPEKRARADLPLRILELVKLLLKPAASPKFICIGRELWLSVRESILLFSKFKLYY
jgi:hypothetical protein